MIIKAILFVTWLGISFGVSAQTERFIYVTGPELEDTATYKYSFWVYRENTYNRIWSSKASHFYLTEDHQEVKVTIPKDVKDTIFEIAMSVERKDNWRYYSYREREEIEVRTADVHHTIPFVKPEKVVRHFKSEKRRLAWQRSFDWDVLQSKTLTLSYHQGHQPWMDVMFSLAQIEEHHHYPLVTWGPEIGTELNFEWNQDFLLGPKIGFDLSTLLINAGLHAVAYTDFDRVSWYLKPRIGLNPLTPLVNIDYSYAIRLGTNHFGTRINTHQLTLNFTIPLYID